MYLVYVYNVSGRLVKTTLSLKEVHKSVAALISKDINVRITVFNSRKKSMYYGNKIIFRHNTNLNLVTIENIIYPKKMKLEESEK